MDATKTGAFIAMLRKEKLYTQKELAQKLNVSDKAISRWETGRGFPDTALLKPLSDILGISVGELLAGERIHESRLKAQTDEVIINSLHSSRNKITVVSVICVVLSILIFACIMLILSPSLAEPSAVDFVNSSQSSMLYSLAKVDSITYGDMEKREFDDGYEYYLADGTQRYVFTKVSSDSNEPVLSYMHCSGNGMLFGIRIGDETFVKANSSLGISGTSLMEYLEENGFQWEHDAEEFGRTNVVYIDGERCNWIPYTKDNVFINICISAYEGRRLLAYDIGIIDNSLAPFFNALSTGCPLELEDPYGLVTCQLKETYPQWSVITITAAAPPEPHSQLYLYVNGQMLDKFSAPNPPFTTEYEISFEMWGAPVTLTVTPDEIQNSPDT